MKRNKKIILSMICSFILIFLGIFTQDVQAEENEFCYLSDIPYVANQSSVGWREITKDKTPDNTPLTLKVEGAAYTFEKGIFAHATSTIVYDLTNYSEYAYFTAYIGLNTTSTRGDGVKFDIFTSVDGKNWESKMENGPLDILPGQNATFVKIDIKEVNYLKLVADDKVSNASDHSVYADAKLIKESYDENSGMKTLAEYNEILKKYEGQDIKENKEYELTLLQRELVSRAGEYALKRFINEDETNKATIEWLFSDVENIRYYILGGTPTGGYYNSLKELTRLLQEYKNDFDITETSASGIVKGKLYKRLAIAISLTHSSRVGLWMQANEYNNSDAVVRYKLYKDLYDQGKFRKTDKVDITPWFEDYNIEELRWVVGTLIDDEEVVWLNEYVQSKIDAAPNSAWGLLTPHSYIAYVWPNYSNNIYYSEENKEYFNELFSVNGKGLFEYIPYRDTSKGKIYKLWMNFRNKFGTGCVCGGISKSGHCIRGVNGIASAVIGQPGHAALLYYTRNSEGKGYWGIDNDVSGWNYSEKGERMLLGWGNDRTYVKGYNIPYVVLAQEALNDYDNLEKAEEILFTASLYKDDKAKQEQIYREVLAVQSINLDAWAGLAKLYIEDETKTEEDYYQLEVEMMEALKCFPFPMHNLSTYISTKFTSAEYQFKFALLQEKMLIEAKNYPNEGSKVLQPSLTRGFAAHLLGQVDTTLATFSFDGEDAGKIVLSERFNGNGIRWDYSLDGKNTWNEIAFTAEEEHKLQLTDEQISTITSENDIYVHIVGANYSDENVFKIDIQESEGLPSTLYPNDLENKLIAAIPTMKWQIKGDSEWKFFKDEEPDLTGNKTLVVKAGARGVYLESNETREFTFTEDVISEERKYISISHLSINAVSTEATGQGRYATNAIDGNIYTNWHSAWNGSDRDKFIVIKLDEPKNLTALEYLPVGGGNGKIESAQIFTSLDGENWTEVVSGTDWRYANTNDVSMKSVDFEPTKAQYIKIVGKKTQAASASNSFMVAAMFNLYENKTVEIVGTYSFDGENSGKIILLDEYKTLNWKYSLDSGTTWNNGDGETHQLTTDEMNQIDENNKIKIKFDGNETVYTINIKKGEIPNITPYLNDLENRLIGVTNSNTLEWKLEDSESWRAFSDEEPVVEGNNKLLVRAKATGIYTASDVLEYQFTEDNDTNTEKYISIRHLSIHEYSTQSIDSTRPFYAPNAIDGNRNTIWHTDFRYSIVGNRAFVTIKLDESKNISALEFVQKKYRADDPCYIKNAVVYVSENATDWIEAGRLENCEQNEEFKKIKFNESVYGQYVKLEMEGYDIFASVAMINLYEDTTAKKVADFSFDGENSGKVILVNEFKGSNWVYSLDSGVTWKQSSGDEHTLTVTELEELNSNDKIKIRFENNNEEYSINIQKASTPTITAYLNDLENRLIGVENKENLEWKIEGNTRERSINNEWTDFSEEEPIVEGNKKLLVRAKARNVFTASDALEYQFAEDNQTDTRKYVPVSRLSIAGVSAEDKAQNGAAVNAIDGNYNTRWLNSSAGTDTEKYIIIKLDSAIYLSALDYVPHNENGKILTGKILGSMDGENFTEIKEVTWNNNQTTKTVDFDEAVKVRYVKIVGIETSYTGAKRHVGARMFNFYEDITKKEVVVPTAEIEYDIETLTNHDVVATLVNPSTEITVLNNNGEMTHTFTENGTFTFEFEDSEGNKGTATATVDWICKTLPNATFTYDITDPTNKDVTVTVTFDREGTVVTNNNGSNKHTFEENGEFTFEFKGPYGNEGSATASVDWICKTLPNATFAYDITETTNNPVTVTITFDREGTRVTNNNGSNQYTFEENGEFTFEFVGPYGNSGVATAKVDWIDNTIPKATVKYDITDKTNRNVVATLETEDNIRITNNDGSNTYTFEKNGEFTFEFVNEIGNKGTATAKVTWIDKTAPNAIISYNIIEATNQEVIASISFDKENVTITNNEGSNQYTFTENTEFTFNFIDEAGNTGTAIAKVTWIDKTLPVATINYSKTEATNQDVIARIEFDKEDVIVEGGNTHTFTENGEYEFKFTGPAGNKGVAIAKVTWIDKVVPEPLLVYSTVLPTNNDVTATVVFENEKEGEVTILNNNGNNSYVFNENGKFTFEFSDRAGNKGSVTANVTCIDKTAPTATVSYDITERTNGKVIATLGEASKEITITNNDGKDTYTFTENGEFTFEFIDKAGNRGTAVARVTWIDKSLPVATINYSTKSPTTEPVIATITFDKENVTVEGGNTHTFTENGEYVFEYVDSAGNTGMATAVVTWIESKPDVPVDPTKPSFDLILENSKEILNPGDEFEVNVKVDNFKNFEKGLIALTGKIEYDKEKLEMIQISGQNNWNLDKNSFNESNFKFVTENNDYIKEESIVFKIALKVKETIEVPSEVIFKIVSIEGSDGTNDILSSDSQLVLNIGKNEQPEEAKITSNIYTIKEKYISRVPHQTTVSEFKQNVEANREITILDTNGNKLEDNEIVGTGMTVKVGEELEYTLIVIGDTNGDGQITVTDIAKVKLHLIEKELLTGIEFMAADTNGDGDVTVTDLAQIKIVFIGLPIE